MNDSGDAETMNNEQFPDESAGDTDAIPESAQEEDKSAEEEVAACDSDCIDMLLKA